MGHTIEFERCIDFMTEMIEKYGAELLEELEEDEQRSDPVQMKNSQ